MIAGQKTISWSDGRLVDAGTPLTPWLNCTSEKDLCRFLLRWSKSC